MEHIHGNISEEQLYEKNNRRERIELLKNRVGLLTGRDKILLTMYLENGNTLNQIAGLIGVYPSTVGRRINRVIKRLTDDEYMICLRNRDKFTRLEREIARDHFLRCVPMKKVALRKNMSYYHVRETVRKIRLFAEMIKQAEKRNAIDNRADCFDGEVL